MRPESRDIATKIIPAAVAPGGSHPYTPSWDWDADNRAGWVSGSAFRDGREPEEAT